MNKKVARVLKMIALAWACVAGGAALADSAKSISINFSGSRDSSGNSSDADFSGMNGTALYGALPVAGDNWNNFQTHWSGHGSSTTRRNTIKLCDGTIAQGVSAEWDTSCNYTITATATPNNIFHSFLDASANQYVTVSGLTAENGFPSTCTVYLYCSSDRNDSYAFAAKYVNDVAYTFVDGAVAEGTDSWGRTSFAKQNKLVLGGDYLKIENVSIVNGEVTIRQCGNVGSNPHGSIAAIQIDFGGTSDYALSVNFSGGQNKNDKDYGAVSGADLFGALPVAGDFWNNSYLKTADDVGNLLWNDGQTCAGNVTLSFSCNNTWAIDGNNTPNHLFHSYLDDSPATVTIKGLTAENGFPRCCWLHVYESTDANLPFEPVSVNGVNHTYSAYRVCEGTAAWGNSSYAKSNTLEHGGDYLTIGPVTIPDDGTLAISAPNSNGKNARGGIAAVQVVFATPTEFTVAATCDDANGTVQVGDAAAGTASSVTGTFGTPVAATLSATPAEGYIFDRWEGPMGLAVSGTATDPVISVKTEMPAAFKALFVMDNQVWTATWTGAGTAGDFADPANWNCANRAGAPLEGAIPTEDTTVIFSGSNIVPFPQGTTLVCKEYDFRNVQLAADLDWSGLDLSKPAVAGSTVDLAGYTLKLSGSGDTAEESFTVTDSSAQGGTLLVTVADGAELDNKGVAIAGTVRLVKEGAGTFGAYRAGQSYTGGTHVKEGLVRMWTHLQPLGPCDKTQTVRIEEGASLDINKCRTSCFYNYELGGTIVFEGNSEADSWAVGFVWMANVTLLNDAHIKGGYFYFGSSDPNAPSVLTLNGHTLYMDLTKGAIYAHGIVADATGGKMVFTAGSMQQANTDFSSLDVHFEGETFDFFAGGGAVDLLVRGFSYARNYWVSHSYAHQVQVSGVYTAGENRPPVTLKDGATLDLSAFEGCWSADGQAAVDGGNNRVFQTPGLVSFESGARITVDVHGRHFSANEAMKVASWSAEPADVTFTLDHDSAKLFAMRARTDGLYVIAKGGMSILVR